MQYLGIGLVLVTFTGKITSLLLITTSATFIYSTRAIVFFSQHPGGTHFELHVLLEP